MKELRYQYLIDLQPQSEQETHDKYWEQYKKECKFEGPNMYRWGHMYSNDTKELFLMGVLVREGVKFEY